MQLLKDIVGLEKSSGPSEDEALDADVDDVVDVLVVEVEVVGVEEGSAA